MKSKQEIERLNQAYDAFLTAQGYDKERIHRERNLAAISRVQAPQTLVYDEASGSALDFYAARKDGPLFIWIHGGYWRASSKDQQVFVVPGLVAAGVNVASVDYSLAPAVTITEIVRQVRQSVAWLYGQHAALGFDRSNMHVGGHSAGGHLVWTLLMDGWREPLGLPRDLFGVALSISGMSDLEPLRGTFVDDALHLTEEQVKECSPLHHVPVNTSTRLLSTYGGKESSEFARQSDAYLAAWRAAGNQGRHIDLPESHHFDIILQLEHPGSVLFDELLREIRRERGNGPA